MSADFTVAAGQPIRATHINQFARWLTNITKKETAFGSTHASSYALTVTAEHAGATGNILKLGYGTGTAVAAAFGATAAVFSVAATFASSVSISTLSGALTVISTGATASTLIVNNTTSATGNVTFQAISSSTTALEVKTLSGTTRPGVYAPILTVGNVQNWNADTWDFICSHNRISGTVTGSFVPAVFGLNSAARPADGFGGTTNVPDEVAISATAFAYNTAAGASQNYDGGLRVAEFQTVVMTRTGMRNMFGIEVAIHSALPKSSFADGGTAVSVGDVGIFVHSAEQGTSISGFGSSTLANAGVVVGGTMGFRWSYLGVDTAGAAFFKVGGSGSTAGEITASNVMPRTTNTYTLGGPAAIYNVAYANFVSLGTGNATGPNLTFHTDTDTGFYRATANTLGFAGGATQVFQMASDQALGVDGTATAPGLAYISDTDSGLYRVTANTLALVAGATEAIRLTGSLVNTRSIVPFTATSVLGTGATPWLVINGEFMLTGNGSLAGPSYTFISDTDTGLYRSAADIIGIANGGTASLLINTSGVIDFVRGQQKALGGGTAPTLGTIGGTGPASQAQAGWIAVAINGTAAYLPYWR